MRRLISSVVFSGVAVVSITAAGFWETKPFASWSDKEVQEVMNDSPWSRSVNVVMNSVRAGRSGGGAESDGARGGGGRGGGFPVAPPQMKLLISWRSALPMKLAAVRIQIGEGAAVTSEGQQVLDHVETQYIVTLSGVSMRFARSLSSMKGTTFLKHGSRMIPAAGIEAQQGQATLVVIYGFSRDEPITVEDKDVEFITKLGDFDIKKKFNLKDMVFHGKLEL